ncbi:unnamed protein product [Bursaphelenchus xylophilus]|uniref:(pine wood nematode) hypothetical protein n=1 Tax=Bursaphelenchus xylophilus TaxID=6326 RepID=A0A7I8XJU7_BURXY|nr:unnamed protein product [Bursaphelenchus xylophilus]CAG9125519.1 unnamed protein product [Bursaphelenchus xylophilus]
MLTLEFTNNIFPQLVSYCWHFLEFTSDIVLLFSCYCTVFYGIRSHQTIHHQYFPLTMQQTRQLLICLLMICNIMIIVARPTLRPNPTSHEGSWEGDDDPEAVGDYLPESTFTKKFLEDIERFIASIFGFNLDK